ncbi:MAG: hypothetical protein COA38_08435 [Fluviicola sp.]|nr:MAG: hypothetical protein COA38_08435 [Fluviicola sp.]
MKGIILLVFASFALGSAAQGDLEIRQDRKCYENYDANGKLIPKGQQRYASWECGKLVGVIDCNEKLEYDQDADLVYSGNYGKPFTGRCETCHGNGALERRITFVNGKQNGIDTSYYRNGCIQTIQSTILGEQNGQWLLYYDSTYQLMWEMNYQVGEKHGKHIFFKKEGDTTKWENYNNGLLHGTKRLYYPGSKIKREVKYTNGVMDGVFKEYNIKGIVTLEIIYKQGKKNEEAKYFFDDGTLLQTENWSMGVKNGEFKTFYYQGDIQTQENYKKGTPVGWFIEYYPDGRTKIKTLYDKKGVRIEEHKYDAQGRETYAFGKPDQGGDEDDAIPTTGKKKKKKKKRRKKNKK